LQENLKDIASVTKSSHTLADKAVVYEYWHIFRKRLHDGYQYCTVQYSVLRAYYTSTFAMPIGGSQSSEEVEIIEKMSSKNTSLRVAVFKTFRKSG
jgi:hypothetical protein